MTGAFLWEDRRQHSETLAWLKQLGKGWWDGQKLGGSLEMLSLTHAGKRHPHRDSVCGTCTHSVVSWRPLILVLLFASRGFDIRCGKGLVAGRRGGMELLGSREERS